MDARLLKILDNREQNYPHALEQQYPRIFAKILSLWDLPEIDAYFIDLMVSHRPDRQGFPKEVASDIVYLSMVHARQRGREEVVDVWGEVSDTIRLEIERLGGICSAGGFIRAAESGSREIVGLFLSAGLDVDCCDERRWTPLMVSAFSGNEELALLLIKSGANIHHRDSAGYSPLHWAAFNGFVNVVELLLKRGADVNARSSHGWTALLQAATRGHLSVVLLLIRQGANINLASNDGWTPLHKAAANGHFAEVKLLLNKGADKQAKYSDGTTALDIAIKNKQQQIIDLLSI
jgi:ankyrin repeat protein